MLRFTFSQPSASQRQGTANAQLQAPLTRCYWRPMEDSAFIAALEDTALRRESWLSFPPQPFSRVYKGKKNMSRS